MLQKIISTKNGTTTVISKDTNDLLQVTTSYSTTNSTMSAIIKENGEAQNKATTNGLVSKTTTLIPNSISTIDTDNNLKIVAGEVDKDTYYIKALVTTKPNGQIFTELIKVSKSDENNITSLGKTLADDTPFGAGTNTDIKMIEGSLFIKMKTPITNNLIVQ